MTAILTAIRNVFAPQDTPIAPRSGVIGGLILFVAMAMTFIAVIAFEAGLAAERLAGQWSGELSQSATVRIVAAEDELPGLTRAALGALEVAPGVAAAEVVGEEELQTLLAPWLGRDADIEALPLPVMIDVSLSGAGPDPADIQRQLDLVAPGAVYDDHGQWRAPLIEGAKGLRRIAIAGVALALLALSAMVAVAATASLWAGAGVVLTLRLIGAEDRFISRAFERQFALRAAIGGVFGAVIALIITARMPRLATADIFAPTEAISAGPHLWLVFVAPAITAIVALVATRTACFFVLRRGV